MTEQEPMQAEFAEAQTIHASPEAIFTFVSDIRNLPKYLPTTKQAMAQQGERVRVQGEANGHTYDADGFLRADADQLRMEWGADEHDYAGNLEVRPTSAGSSEVTVRLIFSQRPGGAHGPSDADIREGLRKALQSIENHVTGKGGKVEPRAAT